MHIASATARGVIFTEFANALTSVTTSVEVRVVIVPSGIPRCVFVTLMPSPPSVQGLRQEHRCQWPVPAQKLQQNQARWNRP